MSTFTPSGVRLIADGTESGTWGAVTNVNLQILNRLASEAGTVTLAGTSSTLIVSDGALSPGQYAVVVFGGAPSGTHTVTIDPNDAKRVFFIKNDTNQSVVMQQGDGSGGTVTIPAGQSRVVYCDGAGTVGAFVDVSSSFLPTTLTAISLLAPTDGNFIVGNGSTWVVESGNTALASLGLTATASELNVLDGITASTAELNILDGATVTAAELNVLDGIAPLSGNAGKAVVVNPTATGLTYLAFPEGTVYTAGAGLTLDVSVFSHADTSSATGITTSGAAVIDTLALDEFGHVTNLTTRVLTAADIGAGDITAVTAGTGLTGGGTSGAITVSHADTSTAISVDTAGATIIDAVTIDGFGHVTNLTTRVLTAADIGAGDITGVTAGTGLSGGGASGSVTLSHADTSSQSSVNNSGNTFIQDITVDGFGHITAIGSGTVSIPVPSALSTASGSAPSYSARAWVNFNGTGTVAIRASGNISSITDTGLGRYTMNFATSLPDANYAVSFGASLSGSASSVAYPIMELISQSTSNFQVIMGNRGSVDIDPLICTFMVMR